MRRISLGADNGDRYRLADAADAKAVEDRGQAQISGIMAQFAVTKAAEEAREDAKEARKEANAKAVREADQATAAAHRLEDQATAAANRAQDLAAQQHRWGIEDRNSAAQSALMMAMASKMSGGGGV